MTPFCLVVSGRSQAKDSDEALLEVVLMFNGGPLGAKMYQKYFHLSFTYRQGRSEASSFEGGKGCKAFLPDFQKLYLKSLKRSARIFTIFNNFYFLISRA